MSIGGVGYTTFLSVLCYLYSDQVVLYPRGGLTSVLTPSAASAPSSSSGDESTECEGMLLTGPTCACTHSAAQCEVMERAHRCVSLYVAADMFDLELLVGACRRIILNHATGGSASVPDAPLFATTALVAMESHLVDGGLLDQLKK